MKNEDYTVELMPGIHQFKLPLPEAPANFFYGKLKEINPHRTKEGKLKQVRDFIELPIVQGKERLKAQNGRAIHPTQKPEKLVELIIIAATDENELILDPFWGTGTTGIVASRLKKRWIGIEIDERYFKIACERIFGNRKVLYG